MAVGFGFSVGDFIAALELVGTVIDALRDSGSASAEYRELLRVLYSLETGLMQVKRLEIEESQRAQLIALQQAAAQCQRTIDDFWNKTKKYQPHLGSGSECSNFRMKTAWTKIKWSVCKRDDVAKFKADLIGHTESIQMLLGAIQVQQNSMQQTLLGRIQDSYQSSMQRLSTIADGIGSTVSQGKQLLDLMAQTAQTNVQVFAIILNIQNILKQIPRQVQRQQPVFLIDALGRHSPFHLEFIRSADALVAVLRSNFSKIKQAPRKIDRGEFVIQDAATKRDIDLAQDWELCFRPGQHVDMSMIFDRSENLNSMHTSCPSCKWICGGAGDTEIECAKCGLAFQRIRPIDSKEELVDKTTSIYEKQKTGSEFWRSADTELDDTNDKEGDDTKDDPLGIFKRIRLRISSIDFVPTPNTICRPPRDDERDVMQHFAAHASHCLRCADPFRVYMRGGTLCDRGHAYARDAAQYIYSKAGKAHSVIDRNTTGDHVQIEIPPRYDVIRGLLKAVDRGLKIRSQTLKQVVSSGRTYRYPLRRRNPKRGDEYDVVEVAPRRGEGGRRRETVYVSGRGSLYEKDEEERRGRMREQGEPVLVYAEPPVTPTTTPATPATITQP